MHYRKILHSTVNNQSRTLIVLIKQTAPYKKTCLSENTLYQADISTENFQTKINYGISKTRFKTSYSNHEKSFNHEKHKNDTQLSSKLWKIKASKEESALVWKIVGQHQPYNFKPIQGRGSQKVPQPPPSPPPYKFFPCNFCKHRT